MLITLDLDLADIHAYPPGSHAEVHVRGQVLPFASTVRFALHVSPWSALSLAREARANGKRPIMKDGVPTGALGDGQHEYTEEEAKGKT